MTSVSSTSSSVLSTASTAATGSTSTGSTSGSTSTGSTSGTTSISGTGLLSSLGVGSGLDVTSIITALVNAKQAGPQAAINSQTAQDNNEITGLTALSTSLSSLQSALTTLTNSTTYQTYDATLSNTAVASATTLSDAVPGSYAIDVTSLATAQKRVGGVYASTAAVGSGTLAIAVGSSSMNIAVSATDSLSDIATSINNASDNPGVSATVVNGASGAQLVLTSTKTGVANAFSITASSDSSSGLSTLATSLNTAGSNEATDANLTIDGIAVSSASNSVNGALAGVTLNLTSTGTSELTVAQDTSVVSDAVQGFVTAYNSYASMVGTLSSYDTSTGDAGILLGDSTLASVQRQISSALGSSVSGNSIGSLAALGITRSADGTMALDSDTLNAALTSNPSAVQGLFAGTNGIASKLNTTLDGYTDPTSGILQTRITSLNSDVTKLASQTTALNARMQVYQAQLTAQYTALDSLVSSLNNTSSYLTQSMDALNKSSDDS